VFIGGGGELGTAREVLRHQSVESVVMVDIDKAVVDISIAHLSEWHEGCHTDIRLQIVHEDAAEVLESYAPGQFDLIIMDISDAYKESDPQFALYTGTLPYDFSLYFLRRMLLRCVSPP
jgi:spermidine synthase